MYLELKDKKIKLKKCNKFKDRLLGLMFKKNITYGLIFPNCNSIHTFFMRENIDVIFLDKNDKIIKIKNDFKPFRIIVVKNCKKIIELPKDSIKDDLKEIKIVD